MPAVARNRFVVTGQVQGVGFRPFVFRLAADHALTGTVKNAPEGVVIELQGAPEALDAFEADLTGKLPPLARIVTLAREPVETVPGEEAFAIVHSAAGEGHSVLISPDTATCPDCLGEMFDEGNRRRLYAFTNCTNCGPRYTITRSIPYDRPFTSMACFPLCPACKAEYENPLDRRFHAQPNACPECGPSPWLAARDGTEISRGTPALEQAATLLAQGKILAVKGLGGFHLACDAANPDAVAALRERKRRHGKPLAVMVADLDAARALGHVSDAEAKLLAGIQRPIVLVRKRDPLPLAPGISPDTDYVGVMLPYAPLQHVLLHFFRRMVPAPAALVMTSGNASSEPICLGNREALARLAAIADGFVFHDRDILIRTDDSVARVHPETGETLFLRRARGYTPSPVFLAEDGPCVLGTGPELKNTLCVTKGDQAFVSQHIGDMENLETLDFYREIAAHLPKILKVTPQLAVHDLHPDYMTTRWAREESGLPTLALQHHYAHIHSVLAEHRHRGPAVGLALDGTGYGEDRTLWGGECLYVDPATLTHRRLGRFAHLRLPGGEAAIREVWRIGQAALFAAGLSDDPAAPRPWLPDESEASRMVDAMLARGLNSPLTSSCGRLFDAVAAILGLKRHISYEGQAAIVLEQAQDFSAKGAYDCPLLPAAGPGEPMVLDTLSLIRQAAAEAGAGVPAGTVSRRFHRGLIAGLADMAAAACAGTGVTTVGLSGGVMLNLTVTLELPRALTARGLNPLSHLHLPPGDACISLGQAAYGRRALALGKGGNPG